MPYGDLGKTEIVRNPQGDYTLMMGIVGGKGLHLTGSLAELTTYVSRWQAVTLNAPPIAYASMSDENPSMAIDWLKTACDKLVNVADWVVPAKEGYAVFAGSDYDTGQRLTWTQRTLRGVTAAVTAIVAIKVGRVAVKAGARVLGWVLETRAGKVVKKAAKSAVQYGADLLEKKGEKGILKKIGDQVRAKANLKIQPDKQGKHIKGHNSYDSERLRSILSHNDPQGLVDKYAGRGIPIKGAPGEPGYRELVNFGEVVGQHVLNKGETQILTETTFGQIHYAKDGVHIVPAHPDEWRTTIEFFRRNI